MKQQKKKKGRSVQELMGIKTFTKYGLSTNKGELLFYLVSPTNISVLSHTNIEIKIRHLMMVLSALPDIEIVCTDSSECFDDNKAYLTERLDVEENGNSSKRTLTSSIPFRWRWRPPVSFSLLPGSKDRKKNRSLKPQTELRAKSPARALRYTGLKSRRSNASWLFISMRVCRAKQCPTLTANSFTRVRTMRTRNKPVLIFFCLLLSAAAVLAGVNIYSELKERQKEKEDFAAVSQIAEPTVTAAQTESEPTERPAAEEPTERPAAERNIQALITENADCIGWLSIDGTNISYPVMHTPHDPQKYLRRNFYGKYSQSGVPFLDGRCDLQSSNLIIYGHNMRNGTMFSDLKKYLNTDFLNSHRTIRLETVDGVFLFTVSEVRRTNISNAWYNRITSEDGRQLILSTCYGSGKDGRLLIIAAES